MKRIVWFVTISLLLVLSACAANNGNEIGNNVAGNAGDNENAGDVQDNNENEAHADGDDPEEITLKFMTGSYEYEERFREPLEAQFPHINFELIADVTIEEAMAAHEIPDVMTISQQRGLDQIIEFDLAYDQDQLIDAHGFDLERLEPNLIQDYRYYSGDHEELYAIPYRREVYVTHFNKDIFDEFAMPYPEDDMTWEETIQLAQEVTGQVGDITYRGLDLDVPEIMQDQIGTYNVDPDTHDVLVTEDPRFRDWVELVERITEIPGNYPGDNPGDWFHQFGETFMADQISAMLPMWQMIEPMLDADGLNFDIVTYPVFEDNPGIAPPSGSPGVLVTKHSEQKDAAWEVVDYILSDEFQMHNSRDGIPTPLVSTEVQETLGENIPGFQDLNTEAIYKHEPHPGRPGVTVYDGAVQWWGKMIDYINSGQDVDEFLREVQAEGEQELEHMKLNQ